jgi:hypothetical protein
MLLQYSLRPGLMHRQTSQPTKASLNEMVMDNKYTAT